MSDDRDVHPTPIRERRRVAAIDAVEPDEWEMGDGTPGIVRKIAFRTDNNIVVHASAAGGTTSGWHHHGDRDVYGCLVEGNPAFEFGPGGATDEISLLVTSCTSSHGLSTGHQSDRRRTGGAAEFRRLRAARRERRRTGSRLRRSSAVAPPRTAGEPLTDEYVRSRPACTNRSFVYEVNPRAG